MLNSARPSRHVRLPPRPKSYFAYLTELNLGSGPVAAVPGNRAAERRARRHLVIAELRLPLRPRQFRLELEVFGGLNQ